MENRQIHLVTRPKGMPALDNFKLCVEAIPVPNEGEVLIRSLFLSVDPYMRGRLGGRPSSHPPFEINRAMNGEGVGCVKKSKHPLFRVGDIVYGNLDWADYSVVSGSSIRKLEHGISPSTALALLEHTAMTAYFGLLEVGQPCAGETVVLSGAAGAVGTVAGQIAKIKGCRVVGLTGSEEKAHYLLHELQFDTAINYRQPNWISVLASACPRGVDLYFDNVGGGITDEVIKQINQHARIVLCGQISAYNLEQPDLGPRLWRYLTVKSAMARGFLVKNYQERFSEAREQLWKWFQAGKIKPCTTILEGLESLPRAFLGLFSGDNLGKQLVQVETR